MKIQFKGQIKNISEVVAQAKKDGSGTFDIQTMVVTIPGYHDGFEKKGKDENWEIQLFDKAIKEFKLSETFKLDDKVHVEAYLNSQTVLKPGEKKDTIIESYFLNLSLAKISKF